MKTLGMQDTDILEVCGWRSTVMLRRYTGRSLRSLLRQPTSVTARRIGSQAGLDKSEAICYRGSDRQADRKYR